RRCRRWLSCRPFPSSPPGVFRASKTCSPCRRSVHRLKVRLLVRRYTTGNSTMRPPSPPYALPLTPNGLHMLTKRIIPCLDVKDGRVVKGVSFVNLRDAGDPVDVATVYDREGADELCFLDITASHENRKTIIDVVEQTAAQVFMPLTVGGGVRTIEDIRALLNAGADKVSINTAAVQRPEFVKEAAERFGTQCIVVAIDAKHCAAPGWE